MRKIYNFITNIILVVLVLMAAILFLPRVFGLTPLAVLSGSMEPTYHVGSLIYVADVQPEEIEVGDPITYHLGAGDTLVTHRVVAVNGEEQSFRTKGDANEQEDGGSVPYASLVGRPVFSIPLMGYVAAYAATRTGMILLITAIVAVMILTFIPDMLLGKNDDGGAR